MIRRVLQFQLPFYAVFLAFLILGGGVFLAAYKLKGQVLNYQINLGEKFIESEFSYGSWPALADAEFFEKTKERFLSEKANFIEANLSEMTLTVHVKGESVLAVPIKAKGKPGSWWETPAGLYEVKSKNKNQFSGFGQVYMPWSMQFQGNFFIHGWPYYPGGEPVATSYSGGCIRLLTEDAEKVYQKAVVGMPVLVFEEDFAPDNFPHRDPGPRVGAPVYFAADMKDNFVFLSASSTVKVPVASITKLMTALVATEYINLDHEIAVSPAALVATSKPRLAPGQRLTAYQLLYPLLRESSNEAAEVLALNIGKERFVRLMNEKAKALGMKDSTFADPSGRSAENISTAEDLFILAKYLYNNRSFILKISAGHKVVSAYESHSFSSLENFNVFADDPAFLGGKVGETNSARQTIMVLFEKEFISREGAIHVRPIVIVVLGSQDRAKDARAVLEYITANF